MSLFRARGAPDRPASLLKLDRDADLDAALGHELAVICKHSPICALSSKARREVRRFAANHPGLAVYLVNVITEKARAQEIERRTGIRHESPQAIVFRKGHPVWHGSHGAVTDQALTRAVSSA